MHGFRKCQKTLVQPYSICTVSLKLGLRFPFLRNVIFSCINIPYLKAYDLDLPDQVLLLDQIEIKVDLYGLKIFSITKIEESDTGPCKLTITNR